MGFLFLLTKFTCTQKLINFRHDFETSHPLLGAPNHQKYHAPHFTSVPTPKKTVVVMVVSKFLVPLLETILCKRLGAQPQLPSPLNAMLHGSSTTFQGHSLATTTKHTIICLCHGHRSHIGHHINDSFRGIGPILK